MKGNLRVSVGRDGSNDCELSARFQNAAFSGEGSAWFNVAEIEAFAKSLASHPLRTAVSLQGGFWHSTERRIDHEHLFLAAYPIDGVGHIGFKVRATTPIHSNDRPEQKHSSEIELRIEYEQLRHFSAALVEVIHGARTDALLESHDF
jgi:hypothetical protein